MNFFTARPTLGPIRNLPRAVAHRWPTLAVAAVAAAAPLTVALAADFNGQIVFDGGRYTAVYGLSDFGPTISGLVRGSLGTAISGEGYASGTTGVRGTSAKGTGVYAESDEGTGLHAFNRLGSAIKAESQTTAMEATAQTAIKATSPAKLGDPTFLAPGSVGVQARAETGVKAEGKYGIDATAQSTAVNGYSQNTTGVYGVSAGVGGVGVGAYADRKDSIGVSSFGDKYGVYAEGNTGVVGRSSTGHSPEFSGTQAPLRLQPAVTTGAPKSGTHKHGELLVDSQGQLFLCTADSTGGNAGTWKQVTLK
jgi:hypothetical protein